MWLFILKDHLCHCSKPLQIHSFLLLNHVQNHIFPEVGFQSQVEWLSLPMAVFPCGRPCLAHYIWVTGVLWMSGWGAPTGHFTSRAPLHRSRRCLNVPRQLVDQDKGTELTFRKLYRVLFISYMYPLSIMAKLLRAYLLFVTVNPNTPTPYQVR